MGCHGNDAFSHSPNKFFRTKCFVNMGSQSKIWHPSEIVLRSASQLKLDHGVNQLSRYGYIVD